MSDHGNALDIRSQPSALTAFHWAAYNDTVDEVDQSTRCGAGDLWRDSPSSGLDLKDALRGILDLQ